MTAVLSGTNGLLQNYDYQVLTTGFTYTFAAGTQVLVINPAGTLATGTITMPATPADGMTITFSSSQQITALTMSGNGASIVNAVTTLPAKTSASYVYRLTNTTWYPAFNVPGVMTNGTQLYRLNADLVIPGASGAQSMFGVGVTLLTSTIYEFEMVFGISKSSGTTSHNFGYGFGGTATLNNIGYLVVGASQASSFGPLAGNSTMVEQWSTTASNTNVVSGVVSAAYYHSATIKGTVSVNAGGTFIPQYSCSSNPGGAYTTSLGSYVKIYPIGASGSATNVGSWA
jgi:hypothetical protein